MSICTNLSANFGHIVKEQVSDSDESKKDALHAGESAYRAHEKGGTGLRQTSARTGERSRNRNDMHQTAEIATRM